MSLQQQKKLADYNEQIEQLYQVRNAMRKEKLKDIIKDIKQEFVSYLEGEGFQCTDNAAAETIEATYKKEIVLYLKYYSHEVNFMGCDSAFEFKSKILPGNQGKEIKAIVYINTNDLPHFGGFGTASEMLTKKIAFYEETLLPKLKSIGVSDITGDYTFGVRQDRNVQPKTIPEIINELMEL